MAGRILILGGTGILGPILCNELLKNKHIVYLFNRGNNPGQLNPGVHLIKGDRCCIKDLEKLRDLEVDSIIDTMGWFYETLPYIVEIFSHRIKRYIFISSIAAYSGDEGIICREEECAGEPNPIWGIIGQNKRKCEIICEKAYQEGFPVTILRLTHLYGYMGHMSREMSLLVKLMQGEEIYIPNSGRARLQFIHYLDVARVCLDLLENNLSQYHNCYNVSSDRIWTILEWVRQCAEWVGIEAKLNFCEYQQNNKSKFLYLPGDVVVDTERIKAVTGKVFRCPDDSLFREVIV